MLNAHALIRQSAAPYTVELYINAPALWDTDCVFTARCIIRYVGY